MIKITVDNSSEFYQFDVNRSVIVSGLDPGVKYEFHFTTDNMDSVIVKETTIDDDGNISSKIPNKLLTEHYPIILLIYGSHDGITKTYYKGSLTPIARPKPDGYVLPDDEDDVIAYFKVKKDIDALKTAVENLKNNGGSGGGDYSEDIENILAEINALKLFDENVLKNYTTKEELKDYATHGDLSVEIRQLYNDLIDINRVLNDKADKSGVESILSDITRITDNHSANIGDINDKIYALEMQTGDIETALDNVIAKYDLGGDVV